MHKTRTNVPFRPIPSTIGTCNYDLSKFSVNLLSGVCSSEYTIKDSFSFPSFISNFRNDNSYMASFDVTSLFSNIPMVKTITVILNKLFTGTETYSGLTRAHFKKLLKLCTRDNLFVFNGEFYRQIDGALMEGCVSPTLADLFL